jgi:hypothetical protein
MTRSILWISSSAPSSPFWIACGALPQPRSRMALAADTRAGAVASFERMMPTRTLSAVRVWLRASERISMRDFGIQVISAGFAVFQDAMVEKPDRAQSRLCQRMNRISCTLKTIPPTPRWPPDRPMQARSNTPSCHSLSIRIKDAARTPARSFHARTPSP